MSGFAVSQLRRLAVFSLSPPRDLATAQLRDSGLSHPATLLVRNSRVE
jgi:hypothetical protein